MGKKYYCDYCDKSMVATPSIIRTHINGVVHQKLVNEHYQRYKDPEIVLQEESAKKPCSRFMMGECKFGGICRYSHYTQEELCHLRNLVAAKNKSTDNHQPSFEDLYKKLQNDKNTRANDTDDKNTVVYDENGVTHVLPWNYNQHLDAYGDNLPPSIKKFKTSDFSKAVITDWG
ncbi:zinc finger matrin-type protein 5 isoform X1 [Melitaea cinxia]|uniref:zinc finger matrin-type protein 5 isoform X1 n=1 Tax=Melitaea cinxia TaxID=113334 RepID=UPI001E273956|nr:zinc finger matrin-type protein 5 isoform X1 [Melitaea cinxia]